jgi:hypothetical protein
MMCVKSLALYTKFFSLSYFMKGVADDGFIAQNKYYFSDNKCFIRIQVLIHGLSFLLNLELLRIMRHCCNPKYQTLLILFCSEQIVGTCVLKNGSQSFCSL